MSAINRRLGRLRDAGAIWSRLAFTGVFAAVVWIVIVPCGVLLMSSFAAEPLAQPWTTHFTFSNYAALLSDPATYRVLRDTTIFGIGSTLLGTGAAIFFAWLVERTDIWARKFLFAAILIPMAIPNLVYAISWVQLLSPNNGLINVMLRGIGADLLTMDVYSLGGMIVVQSFALASSSFLLIAGAFRTLDPTFEEQSFVDGKGIFATLWRITLPVLTPALMAAALFFFIVSIETIEIPLTLGLSSNLAVVSTSIYWFIFPATGQQPNYGMACALATVLLLIALSLMSLYRKQLRRTAQFVTVTGRGYRPHRQALGVWRLPLFLLALAYITFAVALPLFILVWRSLLPFYMTPSFQAFKLMSLDGYRTVLGDEELFLALSNTTTLSIVVGVLTVFFALTLARLILYAKVSSRWRQTLNVLAFVPQSIPAAVVALSLILVYLRVPIGIYGTIWIIALAMVTKYSAFALGTMIAAETQLSRELQEASQISGARAPRTYLFITLPLLAPAAFNCLLWVMIHVVRDVGLAIMLYSQTSQTLGTKLWLEWFFSRAREVSAISTMIVGGLLCLLILLQIGGRLIKAVRRSSFVGAETPLTGYQATGVHR